MTATVNPAPRSIRSVNRYVSLPTSLLPSACLLNVDLFCDVEDNPTLCLRATEEFSSSEANPLSHVGEFAVRASDFHRFAEQLVDTSRDILVDTNLKQADRFTLLQAAAKADLALAWDLIKPEPFIDAAVRYGESIARLMDAGDIIPEALFHAMSHESRIEVHATNVSCYAVMLALGLGVNDKQQLSEIAVGAMLHDLGRRRGIQNTTNADDRAALRRHPQTGFEELRRSIDSISRSQMLMVYQHHERVSGGGYPVGIRGRDIHPWAKILAVVNTFDAETSNRGGGHPSPVKHALEKLRQQAGKTLDQEMVLCWMQIMQQA